MTAFPTQPFYIQSKVGLQDYVLVPGRSDGAKLPVKIEHRTGALDELWTATPDPRGGAYICNLGDLSEVFGSSAGPLCLAIDEPDRGARVYVEKLSAANARQMFEVSKEFGDPWVGVRTLSEYEIGMWIHAYLFIQLRDRNNPDGEIVAWAFNKGSGDEKVQWNLIPENGELTIKSITYDTDKAVRNLNLPPRFFAADSYENTTDTLQTASKSFSWQSSKSMSLTTSDSHTSGSAFSQTFGIKGGIKDVVELSSSTTFSSSTSDTKMQTDGKTTTETTINTTNINYSVPPHKSYLYSVKELAGQINVPYTAVGEFKSSVPGVATKTLTINGVFVGVNVYNTMIETKDVTDPNNHVVVRTDPAGAVTRTRVSPTAQPHAAELAGADA